VKGKDKAEGSKLNDRSQGRSTHHASINSPHVLDPREVQTPVGFEGDVCLQFSVFAIQSVELRVPFDANKP